MGMSRTAFMEMMRECRIADSRREWAKAPQPRYKKPRKTREVPREVRHDWLIDVAAQLAETTSGSVKDGCRKRQPVTARQIICMSLFERGYSLTKIGDVLGYHHTSVQHLLRIGQRRYRDDAGFRAKVDAVGDGVFTSYWGC